MIPNQATDITADWLNERLGDQFGTVEAVRCEHIGEGVGILGEVARLHLDYADGETGPTTLIAKCQSLFEENIGLSQMMGFYAREVNFYNQLADQLIMRVPECHIAEMAPEGAPFVLVMEEITGAKLVDQLDGANKDETEQIVKTIAVLHARFWDNDALAALDWLPPMNNDMYKAAGGLIDANWAPFVESWSDKVPAEVLAWCEQIKPQYGAMVDYCATWSPQTYAHTDVRADNFLFGGSAGDDAVTVLDFQLSTRHVGAWDIANFLGASVTVENRRAWQDDILATYHSALGDLGVTGYSLDELTFHYRMCTMHQALAQIAVSNLDPGNERGRALLDAMVTRSFTNALDNNGGELLSHLP